MRERVRGVARLVRVLGRGRARPLGEREQPAALQVAVDHALDHQPRPVAQAGVRVEVAQQHDRHVRLEADVAAAGGEVGEDGHVGHVLWVVVGTWVGEERRAPCVQTLDARVQSSGSSWDRLAPFRSLSRRSITHPLFSQKNEHKCVGLGWAGVSAPNDPTLVRTKVLIDKSEKRWRAWLARRFVLSRLRCCQARVHREVSSRSQWRSRGVSK